MYIQFLVQLFPCQKRKIISIVELLKCDNILDRFVGDQCYYDFDKNSTPISIFLEKVYF